MEKWVGKLAVVTGASSGIGKCILESLAKAGVNVVGLARRAEKIEVKKLNLLNTLSITFKFYILGNWNGIEKLPRQNICS